MKKLEFLCLAFILGVCFFKPIKILVNNIFPILGVRMELPQIPSISDLSAVSNNILINGINQQNIGIILIPIFMIIMLMATSWAIKRK